MKNINYLYTILFIVLVCLPTFSSFAMSEHRWSNGTYFRQQQARGWNRMPGARNYEEWHRGVPSFSQASENNNFYASFRGMWDETKANVNNVLRNAWNDAKVTLFKLALGLSIPCLNRCIFVLDRLNCWTHGFQRSFQSAI